MILEQRVRAVAQGSALVLADNRGQLNLEIPILEAPKPCIVHNVDPTPCYPADLDLVLRTAARCEDIFPLPILPFYFTLPYEPAGRNNACAPVFDFGSGRWTTVIYLSGKRIPIMPAMVRALVAHEYSHHIERYISWKLGRSIDSEYAALRGIPVLPNPRWHEDIGEIIANDIRILMFEIETDYWPHNCDHPYKHTCDALYDFWLRMHNEFSR